MREESRRAHFRSDFPTINNEMCLVNIYCTKEPTDGRMVLYKKNVKEIDFCYCESDPYLAAHPSTMILP